MHFDSPQLGLRELLLLLWGKMRRWALRTFDREYIRKSLERRNGECRRCGACCKLAYVCPFLGRDNDHGTKCVNHVARDVNCVIFPIDEKDIRDRNLINPGGLCGYSFNGKKARARDHVTKMIMSPGLGKIVLAGNGKKHNSRNGNGQRRRTERALSIVSGLICKTMHEGA
ncbi:MAG: hypothetical protein ACYS8W_07755, partial [Planctomycetota bacterium]